MFRFLAFVAALALAVSPALAKPKSAPPAPLSETALNDHIRVLASDAFEGRGPATPGETKTVAYLTKAFQKAGLKPGNGKSYVQAVPLMESRVTNAAAFTVAGGAGPAIIFGYKDKWVGWSKRTAPAIDLKDAPLVFVGYGVIALDKGWDDYKGADIQGKIAVILINDPDFETSNGALDGPFGGRAMTYFGRWTYKFEEAARQGAAGALIIHETAPAAYPWAVVQSSWTGPQFDMVAGPDADAKRLKVEGWIARGAAVEMFQRAGLDFVALKAAAQKPGFKPVALNLSGSTSLQSDVKKTVSDNVVAMIRGSEKPEEVVLFTAHWDHLGRCPPIDGDDICNGAVDNATGTAGLIEIARAFAKGPAPKRSVAFLAVTAEEKGLLGSAYYAANPLFPLAKTVANINMDGLAPGGATRDVVVVGAGKNDLEDVLAAAAKAQGRTIVPEEYPERGGYFRSDQFSLAKVGVPALFARGGLDLVEGGVEAGKKADETYLARLYHKPQDQWSTAFKADGVALDAALMFAVGQTLANGTQWPAWKPGAEFKAIREASLKP